MYNWITLLYTWHSVNQSKTKQKDRLWKPREVKVFFLKTLIFPAQRVYFTIKSILVCFWFREKKNNPLKWIQECPLLSFFTARFQAFWKSIVIVASLRSTSSYCTQKSTHGDGSLIRGTTILTSGCLKIIKTCVLEGRFQ